MVPADLFFLSLWFVPFSAAHFCRAVFPGAERKPQHLRTNDFHARIPSPGPPPKHNRPCSITIDGIDRDIRNRLFCLGQRAEVPRYFFSFPLYDLGVFAPPPFPSIDALFPPPRIPRKLQLFSFFASSTGGFRSSAMSEEQALRPFFVTQIPSVLFSRRPSNPPFLDLSVFARLPLPRPSINQLQKRAAQSSSLSTHPVFPPALQ